MIRHWTIVNVHILDFVICMERLGYIYNMLFVPIFRDFSTTLEMTRAGQGWRKRMRSLEQRFQDDSGAVNSPSTALHFAQNDSMNQNND